MAVSSYSNLFGTTGAGKQGSKAGIGTLFGQQAKPQGDDEEIMRRKQQAQAAQGGQAPQPTFAEKQKMGQARPAPPPAQEIPSQQAPLIKRVKQQLAPGGLTTAGAGDILTKMAPATTAAMAPATATAAPMVAPEAAATGMGDMERMKPPVTIDGTAPPTGAGQQKAPMAPTGASLAQTLQEQLMGLMQGGGYTDEEFNQLRAAQEANLRAEYGAEQQRLNEELARRGLSASSIGAGRMGDLAGQQARALSTMQATLLGQQAEMRQRARETGLATMSDLTRTMMQNEQQQAETRLKEQLGMSELGGVMYKRGPDGQLVPMTDAENKQIQTLAAQEVARKYGIAESELTGMFGEKETLPARTQRQNLAIQLAQILAQSDDPEVLKNIMPYIYEAFGITPGATDEKKDTTVDTTTTTTPRTAKPRGTSTVGQTPGGTTNVPGVTTIKPGIPVGPRETPEEEPVEPRGPQKPSLGRPAAAQPTTAEPTMAEPIAAPMPILQPAEEPAAPPPPAAAPAPAPAPRTLEDELIQILGGAETQPILLPAEEQTPVAQAPVALPPAPEPILLPAEAPAPAPRRRLEDELLDILSGGAPMPILQPATAPVAEPRQELPMAPAPRFLPEPQPATEPAPVPESAPVTTPMPAPMPPMSPSDLEEALRQLLIMQEAYTVAPSYGAENYYAE